MAFRSCILHIGTEKTGSTTLQTCFVSNRAALRRVGIVFPEGLGQIAHSKLVVYALDDERIGDSSFPANTTTPELFPGLRRYVETRLRDEARTAPPSSTLLLSSEHCHSRLISLPEVQRLHRLLSEFCDSLRVIVYLRPQHELAISLYSTDLRAGHVNPPILPSVTSTAPYFDYASLLERWAKVFGRSNVIPRIYAQDEMPDGDVVADFLALMGIDPSSITRVPPANRALSGEAQAFLEYLNPHLREHRGNIVRVVQTVGKKPAAQPSKAQARQFFEIFAERNELIRQEWFPHRDTLFNVSFDRFPDHPERPTLEMDEAFALFAHLWQKTQEEVARLRSHPQAQASTVPTSHHPAEALASRLAAREQELQQIKRSWSWRLTRPLRIVFDVCSPLFLALYRLVSTRASRAHRTKS